MKTYLGRYLALNRPTDHDQWRMPQRSIAASSQPKPTPKSDRAVDLSDLVVSPRGKAAPQALSTLLTDSGTTALVVLHKGRLTWEHYLRTELLEQPQRCFSVTKSVASTLVGLAIAHAAIDSVEAPIGRWLPDLRDPRARDLTIAHLLEMRSGIGFTEGLFPWNDAPRTYYGTDLRQRLLEVRVVDPVGAFFHYNDWHPLLLALMLERATGKTVTELLRQWLWDPLGMEQPASMMVDREGPDGLEHLESGLTATARDLAKFGQLFLQRGLCDGQRLVPEAWIESSTSPSPWGSEPKWFDHYRGRPWGRVLATGRYYYGRMWWGHRLENGGHDFFAMGVLGQHLYVSPDTQTVVVRLSSRFPPGMWWAPVLRSIAVATAERAG